MATLMNYFNSSAAKMLDTVAEFINKESLSGILMFLAAITAMIVANSPLADAYCHFWHEPIGIMFGNREYSMDMIHIVNDGLMSIFFLMVGLEIKRELLLGELSGLQKAAFPIVAAIGGMFFPALIYLMLNGGSPSASGFGIPMATDIAFTLGVMLILGKRVPFIAKIFLMSLAVVDDMGAVLIIAVYYADSLQWDSLLIAAGITLLLIVFNRLGIKRLTPYLILGILLWYFIHASGIHATIAGVILAFCIPVVSKIDKMAFLHGLRHDLELFSNQGLDIRTVLLTRLQLNVLETIYKAYVEVQNPLVRLERILHSWSAFVIMPLFAFANAGVRLEGVSFEHPTIVFGIILGLFVGKPLGIFGLSYLFCKLKIVSKPENLPWSMILGLGLLAGVGFTMSIFIAQLAFSELAMVGTAKLAILIASLLAGLIGAFYLVMLHRINAP